MAWEVEGTDEFAVWFGNLRDDEQISVGRLVELLVEHGPALPFPYSSGIASSRHRHMRELRIQHEGRPYRVLYAFDPRRSAILLLGGDKTGNDRWYEEHVPLADTLYEEYLRELEREGTDMKRHKWSDIKARTKPETRARIEAEARRLSEDLHLSQLRKARGLTQETMAELLGVSQAEVSKMERRTELYVGTLRKFIEAMNGELVIAARFPDGVEIPIRLAEQEDAA